MIEFPLYLKFAITLFSLTIRYFLFCGTAFLIFYIVREEKWKMRKIQKKKPKKQDIQREIKYSLLSFFIFSLVVALTLLLTEHGLTKLYTDINERSIPYFVFSLIALIFIHDTYFYWMHRFMHLPKIFKRVHLVHHKSHNPTPYAAFAFHPIEALIEIGVFPLVALFMPLHLATFVIFSLFMITMNTIGHLGYEIFPENFLKRPVGKYINTSTHHNMHHKYFNANYGLYLNVWDRIMKTNHDNYVRQFDKTCGQER